MKILIIAFSDSIHTAHWIRQIYENDWEIYIFPSVVSNKMHTGLEKVNICIPYLLKENSNLISEIISRFYSGFMDMIFPSYYGRRLARYIKRIKPDVIHTLETQHAGYLLLSVKEKYFKNKKFPMWWHTNWGSDIYLFGRLEKHKKRIRKVLSHCDYYSCECQRDVRLAKEFGFKNEVLPVYPNSGGFEIDTLKKLKRNNNNTSNRKIIMLKGYQGWAGRAFVGLRALTIVKDILEDYYVVIYSCEGEPVEIAAELFRLETGIEMKILPRSTPHEEILRYHNNARISIGLSISDAISTSFLEAIAMGSFPIQSYTSAADEWIKDGKTGMLVPPEDPDKVAEAIKKAKNDNKLVDTAARINWSTVFNRLDYYDLKAKTIASYEKIYEDSKKGQ